MGRYRGHDLDPENHGDWITVARRWSRAVCRDKPWWDADDLEGYILLDMVRWPSDTVEGLYARARSSTADWMRERLGRKGQKKEIEHATSLNRTYDVGNGKMLEFIDLLPDEVEMEEAALADILADWLPSLFEERDGWIIRWMVQGYNLREIGEMLGVTESRISQILTHRIKPRVRRMLKLEEMRGAVYA